MNTYLNRMVWLRKYKLRLVYLLLLFLLLSTSNIASNYKGSQEKLVTLKLNKANLTNVIFEIKRQTDYCFFFNKKNINKVSNIDIDVKDKTVKEVLSFCLKDTDLQFQIEDNFIYLKEKKSQKGNKIIKGKVVDSKGIPLPGVSVLIKGTNIGVATDAKGKFETKIPCDIKEPILIFSFIGMKSQEIKVDGKKEIKITLQEDKKELKEVIVTAKESRTSGTSSKIKRDAINHVQPSSFAELMELLPGGLTKDPNLSKVNSISLRQVGSDVNTSLGTAFIIDGAPLSNNATMSNSALHEGKVNERSTAFKGIDMRTIPTDEIESVEIIRGIPSVKYGDITSGVINIKRKTGAHPLRLRVKSDPATKLFHVSKGFKFEKSGKLNVSSGLLINKQDPRNTLENYKRINSSVRYQKTYSKDKNPFCVDFNFDFTGSFDDSKEDKEINIGADDNYEQSYQNFRFKTSGEKKYPKSRFLKKINYTASVSYTENKLIRDVLTTNKTDMPWTNCREEIEHDGTYIPFKYQSYLKVEGKPVNIYSRLYSEFRLNLLNTKNKIITGGEYRYDKNFGEGEIYDPERPPIGASARPRPHDEVPSQQKIVLFAEDELSTNIGKNRIKIVAGIRGTKLLNLDSKYSLNDKIFFEPRINMQWKFPSVFIGEDLLQVGINAGYGKHIKFPTLDHLYPNKKYFDVIQLNYFHQNEAYRRVNFLTQIVDPTNYDITIASNYKKEIGIDIIYGGHSFYITCFREKLTSGFRESSNYRIINYKAYDQGSVDPTTLTGPPALEDFTYEERARIQMYSNYGNGSLLVKEGIEYQFNFKRIESIKTRITVNGAYFKTKYSNSQPVLKYKDIVINDKDFEYIGEYLYDNGYNKEMFNTNFRFDTYIPRLKLIFSSSVQCSWFSMNQKLKMDRAPVAYIDKTGTRYLYTEESQQDDKLSWLMLKFSDTDFAKRIDPLAMNINLKVTKEFNNGLRFSMFANRIMNYYSNFERNGVQIRRRTFPYFGMELNIDLTNF